MPESPPIVSPVSDKECSFFLIFLFSGKSSNIPWSASTPSAAASSAWCSPLGPVLPSGGPGRGGQVGGHAGPVSVQVVLVVLRGVLPPNTSAAPTPVSLCGPWVQFSSSWWTSWQ